MYSIILFIKAGFWFAVFAAWGFHNKRLMAWLAAKLAPIVFITDAGKVASFLYRLVACLFIYFSLSNVFDAVRMAKFERIAENLAANSSVTESADSE